MIYLLHRKTIVQACDASKAPQKTNARFKNCILKLKAP